LKLQGRREEWVVAGSFKSLVKGYDSVVLLLDFLIEAKAIVKCRMMGNACSLRFKENIMI
jgi:hypothetical protein